jgi:hypothetical protein
LARACTPGIAIPTYVRFAPIASEVRHRSEMSRRANCDLTRRSKEAPVFAAVSAVVTDDSERGKARYITPPYGLRADGPLTTGGCAGAASGAGIRF